MPPNGPAMRDVATTLALVGQLGLIMVGCVILGLLAGRYLDRTFDCTPWLTIALLLAGVAGGMMAVYRMVMGTFQDSGADAEDQADSGEC